MTLQTGARVGPYDIIGPLGAGGMGEVYRARDTKLNRDVAIKVLPELFAADRERLARFEREAQSLAALNHSNIAQIFGLIDSPSALVMELVDGEDLAERLARGPIAMDEALPIARQIAEALEAAHERGIIHRDLKPANIKVTPEGVVKVLDFGLAKALAADSSVRPAGDLLNSPTFTSPAMTGMGVILGTAAYMSPEQAKGKTADKRADIWAFGVVLHEMLTGTRLFACDTPSETVAAVLRADVDLRALPTAIPTSVRRLLERCLERDPRLRLRDIGEARIALTGPFASEPAASMTAPRRQAAAAWTLAGIAAGAAGVWLIAGATMRQPDSRRETAEPVMFLVPPPSGGAFAIHVEWTAIAVSPDGSQLAFTGRPRGSRQSSLWVRPLSAVDARPIPGTDDATSIFWAPDGKSIGFFAGGKMKRIDLTGGAPVTICDVREGIGQTGTWGIDGQILFASVQGEAIMRVPASGGAQVEVIKPDPARKERRLTWPSLLPDGRFVYLAGFDDDSGAIMLGGQDGTAREILRVKSAAQYVDPGYLVFAHDSTLIARRFDAATGTLSGDPIAIADRVNHFLSTGAAQFSASRNGVIAYLPHRDESYVAAFDRSGRELAEVRPRGGYQSLRVVARGRELLFDRVDPRTTTWDVWRLELDRGVETRLTNDPGSEVFALLDDDGNMIYSAARGGPPRLYRRNLATAVDEPLVTDQPGMQMVSDLSPDGRWLLYSQRSARGNFDLLALSLSDRRVVPVRRSPADEEGGHFSRDGEYVAFISDESGRREVYLTGFQLPGAPRTVSTGGGRAPRWSADGRELFYLSVAGQIMSVPVRVARPLEIGKASVLFAVPSSLPWTDFDVTLDGRFIAIVPLQYAAAQPLTVIVDWPSLANRKD